MQYPSFLNTNKQVFVGTSIVQGRGNRRKVISKAPKAQTTQETQETLMHIGLVIATSLHDFCKWSHAFFVLKSLYKMCHDDTLKARL